MSRAHWSKAVVIIVLIVGGLLAMMRYTAVDRPGVAALSNFVRGAFTPLQGGVSAVIRGVNNLTGIFISKEKLKQQNDALIAENNQLRLENNRLREEQQELKRLRDLLGFKESNAAQYELLAARVIARSPSNWYSTLTINRGARDGLTKNMVVITGAGLVGRINAVSQNTAEVLLITDGEGAVGAVVLMQDTRTPGIVEGAGDGLLQIKHIAYDEPLEVGHTVITSGLSEIFPGGLPIGTVVEVGREAEPSGLLKYALVRPNVNFNHLEEVFVLKRELRSRAVP